MFFHLRTKLSSWIFFTHRRTAHGITITYPSSVTLAAISIDSGWSQSCLKKNGENRLTTLLDPHKDDGKYRHISVQAITKGNDTFAMHTRA